MCDVLDPASNPHPSNTRAKVRSLSLATSSRRLPCWS
jgi:hypothetical protein